MSELETIRQEIMADERNASYTIRGIPPVYQIHSDARILLIGQAPGRKVQESLIPFHDASGRKLMEWLGIAPDVFWSDAVGIMPMDFYYPGKGKTGDLPPRAFMAKDYHARLREEMPNVRLTVLIGRYAIDYYLHGRMKENLTETVRNYREYLPEFFPIVHPSPLNARWQKKNPWFQEQVVPDLKKRVSLILK